MRYLRAGKAGLLRIIPLSLPIRCVPAKYKRVLLDLKCDIDLAIVKNYMPSFFRNDRLCFFDFSLSPLHQGGRAEEAGGIFSAIELIREIGLKGQYRVKDLLADKPGPVVLDCGANVGIFSLFAGQINKTSEIYAFEPSPGSFKILEEIISINGIDNIHPCRFALGDRNKDVSMLTAGDGLGISNVVEDSLFRNYHGIKYQRRENVRMLTMDEFVFNIKKLNRVDFIKIDTEGYERRILAGAAETIKKFHPVIACSAYHLPGDKKEIPQLVLKICPEYKYYLENRGEDAFVFWPGAGSPGP